MNIRSFPGWWQVHVGDNIFRWYSDSIFSDLSTLPNENTLEVNVTHQQLSALSTYFKQQIATAPTRVEEGGSEHTKTPRGKGYDIKLETAKEIVFQHKSPHKTRVIGPSDTNIQWLCYKVNMTQIYNLVFQYNPGEAFLALPDVPQQDQIREGLRRTVFIDIWSVFLHVLRQTQELSWIYVEYIPIAGVRPHVVGKYNTRQWSMSDLDCYPYYHIGDRSVSSNPGVFFWSDLEQMIESCNYGLPIRGVGDDRKFGGIDFDPGAFPSDGDNLPTDFDDMEDFLSEFDPEYREYIKRRFTLTAYTSADEDYKSTYRTQLLDSIQQRASMGRELERITLPNELSFSYDNEKALLVHDGSDIQLQRWMKENLFSTFDSARTPLTKGLSENCRYILEDGNEDTPLTI